MKKINIILAIFVFALSTVSVQAEKLDKMIVLNFGNWKFQDHYTYPYWNSFSGFTLGSATDNSPMWDIDKTETTISVAITDDFGGQSGNGPSTLMTFPKFELSNAVASSLFLGVAGDPMGGAKIENPTAAIELSGFDVNYTYNIYALCALKKGAGGSADGKNRETQLIVTGASAKTDAINATENTSLLEFLDIQPTAEGKLEIKFGAGPNNESAYKDFYINTLIIETSNTATGIEEEVSSGISIYPNPFAESVTISNTENIQSFSIFDLEGKVVYMQAQDIKNQTNINLGFLNPGLYFFQTLDVDNQTQTVKLIKK
ncbi:T9SS type A sorting domain-containing protein [Dysgonomonas sp. 520]|uniref:T9SS type A sorting domain-containing protein n=1 Tax=Dysgonomonas sp. 520 TaxID=2302931 RepID=UPI0013D6954A|nr:T9SS type A sorting domain-containing protein [Dysgonomonas sp. 520]NDW08566.1 T9SS C-terminal target domain-containing protein [Dysgonomonas sp. 520]